MFVTVFGVIGLQTMNSVGGGLNSPSAFWFNLLEYYRVSDFMYGISGW